MLRALELKRLWFLCLSSIDRELSEWLVERLARCRKAQHLAWPVIELVGNALQIGVAEFSQVGALGCVLPNQSVRGLVRTALPAGIRPREVARATPRDIRQHVPGKLRTVVVGNAQDAAGKRTGTGLPVSPP